MGDLRVEERPIPQPGPGEVRVRVSVCGVCGTDAVELDRGLLARPPVVLGHEFTGTVDALGEGVVSPPVGALVVCGAGISCGRCKPCRRGRTNLCRTYRTAGLQVDGGLAGYVTVPSGILLDVSDAGLAVDTLGLAQPMSIAVHVVRRSGLRAGDDAVVVGIGGIGSFITYAAAATGARVIAVDRSPDRLALASALGAADGIQAGTTSLADGLRERDVEPDVFFEVSGSLAGLQDVVSAALPGAVIVPVGVQKEAVPVPLGSWTLREYTIVGSVAHVFADDMPDAVRLLASRTDWSDVARTVIPLDRLVEDALEPLRTGRAVQIKALVDPWADAPRPAVHGSA
ncbi:2,3-butanediol dehydrogenase [Microbacterium deminutum]|uniref:2,3-butanediol dehydrogenase n=1 Tax=Microbacterium deminutum TaxID=344164 RepID=A0ABN2RBE7_9MICO